MQMPGQCCLGAQSACQARRQFVVLQRWCGKQQQQHPGGCWHLLLGLTRLQKADSMICNIICLEYMKTLWVHAFKRKGVVPEHCNDCTAVQGCACCLYMCMEIPAAICKYVPLRTYCTYLERLDLLPASVKALACAEPCCECCNVHSRAL